MVITAALRTCLYGSERMDRFVKKVKLTSDAPSTTAVFNSPSDAILQSSARQVADYEGSPLVIVLDSDCEVNEAAICIQSSAMPTIQSRADFEPGVSFSQSHTAKTWLRSTMTEDRLNGLCMISVHREKNSTSKQQFIERVVTEFGLEPRRLQFLFQE